MAENGGKVKPGFKTSEVLLGAGSMAGILYGMTHEAVGQAAQTIAAADPKALIAAASAGGPWAMAGVAAAILLSRTIIKVADRNAEKHENVAKANVEIAKQQAEKALAELHKGKVGNGA